MGTILIGTSSWADRQLLASGWYPPGINTPAGRLAYYAERFGLVEVDTTYYSIPATEVTRSWADNTPDSFVFDVKALGLFTGHGTSASSLPAEVRPEGAQSDERVRRSDLTPAAYDLLWAKFRESLEPIAAKEKLGVVLLQYPPWFKAGEQERMRIVDTVLRCLPFRAAVELRHSSWFTAENVEQTLALLAENDITYCCVDMPQGLESSVPPILIATADTAVVRFHGRSKEWLKGKFRYAYSDEELAEWAGRLRDFSAEAEELHVLFNNCCAGQAQQDAARLAALLGNPPGR